MNMDCRGFEDCLDAFAAGALPAEEMGAVERHILECSACRALWHAVSGKAEMLSSEAGDDLALTIVRRTCGPVCGEAEQRLWDSISGGLGKADEEILQLHVAHCAECRALAETLTELAQVLPEMAALDPGENFTARVLEATLPVRIPIRHPERRQRMRDWWNRLIRRPRFAWEAAYVGTLIVLLALGNPAFLLQSLPRTFASQQMLFQHRDQIIQEASAALTEGRAVAHQSIDSLRVGSRNALDAVVDFTNRTYPTLREKAASWLSELKLALSGSAENDQQPRSRN